MWPVWQPWLRLKARFTTLVGRMDWFRGLRAATALSTPLLLADVTGLTHMGWAGLGGIEAIVSDSGGPYRTRLGRLLTLTLGGAAAVFLGTLAGSDLRWAVPVTLLFCFGWTYSTVLGQPFSSAALLVQVIYICGIGEPDPSWREALLRAGFLLAGGAWATLLSLFLWPIDPYRPARLAVGACYRSLAGFLLSIAQRTDREGQGAGLADEDWHGANVTHKTQLRRNLELAWVAVASVRAESAAETAQGRQLIVLLESADLILARTLALAEHAETAVPPLDSAACSPVGVGYQHLDSLRLAAEWIALLLARRVRSARLDAARQHASLAQLQRNLERRMPGEDADGRFLASQIAEIASNLDTSLESATALRLGTGVEMPESVSLAGSGSHAHLRLRQLRASSALAAGWDQLAANWNTDSLQLRHAARVALVCGFNVILILAGRVGHGYWLMMTSIIVLQPHVSGTMRRGMQRTGGTVGGGILAALLAIGLHSQMATGIALFPLALLALALLPVNYAAFAFFLTPTFVLAFLRHTGDWQLALLRVGNTVAGACIAIAAMTVLFPSYERDRIGKYFQASLVANRRYLEQLIESWANGAPDTRRLALARRATGLAHNDMEESLERVLAEAWARKTVSQEKLLAFAAYLHRFSQSVTGLVTIPGDWDWKRSAPVQARLAGILSRAVALEKSLEAEPTTAPEATGPGTDSATIPIGPTDSELSATVASPKDSDRESSDGHATGARQLSRLERQIAVMTRHLDAIPHPQAPA